jgi:putative DNA primase/helicase
LICGGEIGFDEMNLAPCVGGVPFDEAKYLDVHRRIEQFYLGPRGGQLQLPKERVRDAIHLAADRHSFHPVRDFLSKLEWDGVERIASVLEEILGTEPTELSQSIIRAWFISAVARPLEPGCKVDHVLILVGPQDLGKSSFFLELAGSNWFSDSVIDIQNRDSYLLMRRIWIMEWSELEAMQRARHQDALKAFITSRVDVYRAPYARSTESVPRTSIIVGTTNSDGFLTDATGNRRYWPIRVATPIDLAKLARWRDQLWAEAVVAYRAGEKWWLSPKMEARLQHAHRDFEQEDPWGDIVLQFARDFVGNLTTPVVLEKALDKPSGQWTKSDEMRVAAILRRDGWVQRRVRVGTERVRRWAGPTSGWDKEAGRDGNSPIASSPDRPSQPSQPVQEEEEEVTTRARGEAWAVQDLPKDDRHFVGTVRTSGRGVQ